MSHIFISYSRKDIDFASKIVQALAENKLETWIDWKSIPKGKTGNWKSIVGSKLPKFPSIEQFMLK